MKTQLIETDDGQFRCLVAGETLSPSWEPTNEIVWLRANSHPLEDKKDWLFQKWVLYKTTLGYTAGKIEPKEVGVDHIWACVKTHKAKAHQPVKDE